MVAKKKNKDKDITQKTLEAYNDVFADIVNVLLFKGNQFVSENELEDAQTRSHYKVSNEIREQERDTAKFWKKANVRIAFYGLENQIKKDFTMPLRVISYDGAVYKKQLSERKAYKKSTKQDLKLYPVITLVLYFGKEKWKAPKSIKEYFNDIQPELKPYLSDYKINLFQISFLTKKQVAMFKSDFRFVADYFVQIRKNNSYKPPQEMVKHVYEVLELMAALSGNNEFEESLSKFQGVENKKMDFVLGNMIKKSMEQGMEQGMEKGKINAFYNMIKKGRITLEEAAEDIGISIKELLDKFKAYNLAL